ncbi:MAG: 3-phosphoshikimate 1-carboxyvinyltransferase [Verrucomicrobiota bacterium JB022]|nr:3-phosphoshikimate 1-carboxyvinyltransferase [Verrucomicrobiota bacterium JB022]
MQDPLPIVPFSQPVRARVRVPGSKSLTNRILILAALSNQRVTLRNALFSRDTRIMATALDQVGIKVEADENTETIVVEGTGGWIPGEEAHIHVGNAGTVARFLTAFLALREDGKFHLDGDEAMRKRPMGGLIEALQAQGCEFTFHDEPGCFPFTMETHGLKGGLVQVDASASSQILSALLMVAPYALSECSFELSAANVRRPFVHMTLGLMKELGQEIEESIRGELLCFQVSRGRSYKFNPDEYIVGADMTAASYFLAVPLVNRGGPTWSVAIADLQRGLTWQGDRQFIPVAEQCGLQVYYRPNGDVIAEFTPDTTGPTHQPSVAQSPGTVDFREFSDTFLTLAAIAPLFDEPTKITGIAHTRHQETDRVAAMATELRKLLGPDNVIETEDSLEIIPDPESLRAAAERGVEIDTYDDHRVAMSFAVLGCANVRGDNQPWLKIRNPACCGKTFPNFFEILRLIREDSDYQYQTRTPWGARA